MIGIRALCPWQAARVFLLPRNMGECAGLVIVAVVQVELLGQAGVTQKRQQSDGSGGVGGVTQIRPEFLS
jgi:hypothetical protein